MPRRRKIEVETDRTLGQIDRRLTVFKKWVSAQREAIEFREYLSDRRVKLAGQARKKKGRAELARRFE